MLEYNTNRLLMKGKKFVSKIQKGQGNVSKKKKSCRIITIILVIL